MLLKAGIESRDTGVGVPLGMSGIADHAVGERSAKGAWREERVGRITVFLDIIITGNSGYIPIPRPVGFFIVHIQIQPGRMPEPIRIQAPGDTGTDTHFAFLV